MTNTQSSAAFEGMAADETRKPTRPDFPAPGAPREAPMAMPSLLPLRPEGRAIAFGETVAFLSSVIPAQAGIQCPRTRHSPLDSRLRGNDGNREVGEPKCDCPGSRGGERARAQRAGEVGARGGRGGAADQHLTLHPPRF